MKTIVHKSDGRFHSFHIMIDDMAEMDRLETILRNSEEYEYENLDWDTKNLLNNLIEPCKEITKIKSINHF